MRPVRRRLRAAVIQALLFGVVGPPVGALCFIAITLMEGPASGGAEHLLSARGLVIGPALIVGACLVGAIPAVATGLVFGLLSHGRRWRLAARAAVGAGTGLLITLLCHVVIDGLQSVVAAPSAMLLGIGTMAGGARRCRGR